MNILDDSIVAFDPPSYTGDFNSSDYDAIFEWMRPKERLELPSEQVVKAMPALQESMTPLQVEGLLNRYIEEMRVHFVQYAAPILRLALSSFEDASSHYSDKVTQPYSQTPISSIVTVINDSRWHYLFPFTFYAPYEVYKPRVEEAYTSLVVLTITYKDLCRVLPSYFQTVSLSSPDQSTIDVLKTIQSIYGSRVEDEVLEGFIRDITEWLVVQYKGIWDREIKSEIENWVTSQLLPASGKLFTTPPNHDSLKQIVCDILLDIRIDELFDIIVDYPESRPSINDIKSCVRNSHQRAAIVNSLQQSCSRRLLHGGANTVDVLSGYISIIRCFSILEPRGVLLDKVARPIRRYLKDRDDTIKEVLSGILGDKKSPIKELSTELVGLASLRLAESQYVDDYDDPNWQPDPMDAPPDFRTENKSFDIIGNLISIFENKDVMVKELMKRFSDTMLFSHEFDEETMLMTIELLKLKFGDGTLSNLDVMIKDIAESKRIDSLVHGGDNETRDIEQFFHVDVISKLFWPRYTASTCRAPPQVEQQMKTFDSHFQKLKQGRGLSWLGNLGSVTLDIEINNETVEFVVSPEKAGLISLFQDKEQWMIQDLMKELEMDEASTRNALLFWQKRGLLSRSQKDENLYELQQGDKKRNVYDDIKDMAHNKEDPKEEMRIYWSYVVGMLTNLGAVPAERIHSFLKILVPAETPYTHTINELKQFLDMMIEEEKLVMVGETYKLV